MSFTREEQAEGMRDPEGVEAIPAREEGRSGIR
jgi:hypothetical protein